MPDLIPYVGELPTSRAERQTGRALERVQGQQTVLTAQEVGRVETIAEVTEAALMAVAHVSALESLLITWTPHAEQRLRHIADAGTLGMTEIVLAASRRCR